MKNKGGIIALEFGKKPDEHDDDMPESDEDMGLSAAADAVFDAIKSGDRSGFKDALKSYVDQCGSEPMSDDEGDEDEESKEY